MLLATMAAGKDLKIHGYVTAVNSPTSFELDEYKIMKDASVTIDFDSDEDDDNKNDFPKDLRVGTEIEIKGDYNDQTQELKAKSIKVFTRESRKLKRTALIDQVPKLERKGPYWGGIFRLDGQTIVVNETTAVSIVPNNNQKKAAKQARKAEKSRDGVKFQPNADSTEQVLTSADQVHMNMYASYEGYRLEDGRVQASKIQFKDNELTGGEAKLWKSLTPKIKAFSGTKPGELSLGKAGKFKLAPNDELQAYVKSVSERLIPVSQRNLPVGDPNKIPFQFHVLEAKVPNAFATANGVVTVFTPMITTLENEAQLAFVMSHEIAHATQEHTLRQMEFHKKKRLLLAIGAAAAAGYGAYNVSDLLNLTSAAITNGYQRYLENQADRVGMEYMVAAGYDPREAPRAWKAMSLRHGDRATDIFWDSHDSNTTRRSYLMSELKVNHQSVDYGALRKDSDEFQRIKAAVNEMSNNKKKIKVKLTTAAAPHRNA